VTRVLLGLFESGFFPAATFLLTTWYCRFEVQTRMAVFFSAASLASAFSGLLAAAIVNMDGIARLAGWRWIFILEGIVTVVAGAVLYWVLPDSPQSAGWLEPWEQQYLINRLAQDTGTKGGRVQTSESFQWSYIISALTDWKIWLAVIVYWGNSIPLYGFTYSAPRYVVKIYSDCESPAQGRCMRHFADMYSSRSSIILGLGYTSVEAQLLTVPVYFVGACATILFAWLSDRHQTRWPYIIIPFTMAACAFIALLAIPHPRYPGLTYAFLFAIPAGVYPPIIGILSWVGNNLAPTWKRSVGMALLISIGNLGGAIGSNIFLQEQAPKYWLGYGFCLGILMAGIVATLLLRWAYGSLNKERDRMSEAEVRQQYSEEDLLAMGDKSPLYRYVV
jgi:MFS family permease